MGYVVEAAVTGRDTNLMELLPLGRGEGVAFHGEVIDIVGGQYLINSRLINTLHGYECVGKDLLHMPAVGIEFRVATTSDATLAHMIYVQRIGYCLHALCVEHDHSGEEVVFGSP